MKKLIVGYAWRYTGEKQWRMQREHPGPLPDGHASRQIRPMFLDMSAPAECQKYKLAVRQHVCPYDDPNF